jgi:hypothetical protein
MIKAGARVSYYAPKWYGDPTRGESLGYAAGPLLYTGHSLTLPVKAKADGLKYAIPSWGPGRGS